jgi:7-carboxy-7-deazaguanine synthase
MHITIETAGTTFEPVACDLMSISPKLSDSAPRPSESESLIERHESRRINLSVLKQLMASYPYQLKFVVESPGDVAEIESLLAMLGDVDPADVLLMPEGTDGETLRQRAQWLVESCKERGFRYCSRLHIELFGHRRGV